MNSSLWLPENSTAASNGTGAGGGGGDVGPMIPDPVKASSSSSSSSSAMSQLSAEKLTVVMKCAGLLAIGLFGTFGNTLTILAIRTTPQLWTKSNMLLAGLQAAHLSLAAIHYPAFIAVNLYVYVFSSDPCRYRALAAGLYPIPKSASHAIYCHFIVIALDRYAAVVYPLYYEMKVTQGVIKGLIAGCYAFGVVVGGVYFTWFRFIDWNTCGMPYSAVMTAVIDGGMYAAFTSVTIFVYAKILMVAAKHRARIDAAVPAAVKTGSQGETEASGVQGKGGGRRKEFKAAKMTATLVCAYTLPLLPYEIGRVMQAVGNMSPYTVQLIDVGSALGNLNTGFDWVIYGVMNKTFRRAFLKLLRIKTNSVDSFDESH